MEKTTFVVTDFSQEPSFSQDCPADTSLAKDGGIVRYRDATAAISINRHKRTDTYINCSIFKLSNKTKDKALAYTAERILLASGVKKTAESAACQKLYHCPTDMLSNWTSCLQQSGFVISDRDEDKEKWSQKEGPDYAGTIHKSGISLKVYTGVGIKTDCFSDNPYIALNYRTSLFTAGKKRNSLLEDVSDIFSLYGIQLVQFLDTGRVVT